MSLHKMVDGVRVEMSREEEAALKAEWAANDQKPAAKPPTLADQIAALPAEELAKIKAMLGS